MADMSVEVVRDDLFVLRDSMEGLFKLSCLDFKLW